MKNKYCSNPICDNEIEGMGNNPQPLLNLKVTDSVCDRCNEEFVIPADVVSGLGNGSSDAGAEKLFAMMDRVRKARTGTKEMGKEITAERLMPA